MKMDEQQLLDLLNKREDDAAAYVWSELGGQRDACIKEYYRQPYGNEEEGWSDIVTSDVQDTVEWVLPGLLKIFTGTEKAVVFDPQTQADVIPAEQATDACNHVFYKQNNGFMVLYTAIKDSLITGNGAVHWRKEEKETVSSYPFKQATAEMLAMLTEDAEITESTSEIVQDQFGNQTEVFSGRLKVTEKRKIIKVEAFNPSSLLISKDWTTPLLQECPYICRLMKVTLSDVIEMGFDVDADDLTSSDGAEWSQSLSKPEVLDTVMSVKAEPDDDESQSVGYLRVEYVLVDQDGDGISERREIIRLRGKILSNEICSHVPIATASPILNTHQWAGMSLAEMVSDLQKLHTELIRQTLNSLYLSTNNRTAVLTDVNGNPKANIDDLLDSRPGGIVREHVQGATREIVTPFVGQSVFPMLEYTAAMRENRTGVTRYNQGIDANSLNKTASGINAIMTASQQRQELIARIFAETLLKPIFQGTLKLLTEGDMEKLAFRLRDEFVEYDPNEWRDWYDMTVTVGLGTGNTEAQMGRLMAISQAQVGMLQMGTGMVTPKNMYNTHAKMTEAAGFKNVQDFWTDPEMNQQMPNPQMMGQQMQAMQMQLQQLQGNLQQAMQENASLKLQVQNKAGELQIKSGELELKARELGMKGNDETIKAQTEITVANIEAHSAEKIAAMETAVQQMAQRIEAMQMLMGNREPVSVNVGGRKKTVAIQAPSGQTYTGVIEEQGDDE